MNEININGQLFRVLLPFTGDSTEYSLWEHFRKITEQERIGIHSDDTHLSLLMNPAILSIDPSHFAICPYDSVEENDYYEIEDDSVQENVGFRPVFVPIRSSMAKRNLILM